MRRKYARVLTVSLLVPIMLLLLQPIYTTNLHSLSYVCGDSGSGDRGAASSSQDHEMYSRTQGSTSISGTVSSSDTCAHSVPFQTLALAAVAERGNFTTDAPVDTSGTIIMPRRFHRNHSGVPVVYYRGRPRNMHHHTTPYFSTPSVSTRVNLLPNPATTSANTNSNVRRRRLTHYDFRLSPYDEPPNHNLDEILAWLDVPEHTSSSSASTRPRGVYHSRTSASNLLPPPP
uniref:Protein transport protein SEC31 n=1 Tax=Lygus hesperus TaxID=30085 RepID=A0A0A9WYC0_LYGHE